MDLIDRQAAIDVAFDIFPDDEYFREQFVKGIEALPSAQPEITIESAIDYLHSIGWMREHDRVLTESAQPEQRWIPCREGLPKRGESVLASHIDGDVEINHIVDEFDIEWYKDNVVAWMPLPEPYQEGEQT